MHVDLTPNLSLLDVQTSLMALAGELRGQHLDWGCRVKAAGVVTAYAGQVMPHDPPLIGDGPCPDCDEDKAKLLQTAAEGLTAKAGADAEAIPWSLILSVVVTLLDKWLKR